ncbi:MAG: hypothetical protein IJR72_00630 [Oscillospiraceae bacterium]|nr:hypothetical protein [Oscillospiraceae bacterium]
MAPSFRQAHGFSGEAVVMLILYQTAVLLVLVSLTVLCLAWQIESV